jgi:virginiamycin B lyase
MSRTWVLAVGLLAAACAPAPDTAQPEPDAPTPQVTAAASPGSSVTERSASPAREGQLRFDEFPVPAGDGPHDVAPAPDGRVWYTAQRAGMLGVLDPDTAQVQRVPLGRGSAPHGVIVGPDDAAWVTDSGRNAIVRVDPVTLEVTTWPLSRAENVNLNTAAFDGDGVLWFTGQGGVYGRVDPAGDEVEVFDAPSGTGPYGMDATPDGTVWFASLAGSYIARIDSDGRVEVVDVPTAGGGARRVWSDSRGDLWVTEWNAGKLARYDPDAERWREWTLPGDNPQPYAVFVDDRDIVWVTDFGADALVRFDPRTERMASLPFPTSGAEVRQLLGRSGEVWGAGSGTDTLIVLRTG